MNSQVISHGFPPKDFVLPGAVLASIAHAIFITAAPFMAHEQSWDGLNYNVQNTEVSRGTISFGDDKSRFVAVFYLEGSDLDPIAKGGSVEDNTARIFQGLPSDLQSLSENALQYVLQDIGGKAIPVITAAFWSNRDSSKISGNKPWPEILKHGANLVQFQTLETQIAMARWTDEFELSPEQVALTNDIFERKMAAQDRNINLTAADVQKLRAMADDDSGFEACRESFREMGVIF
jgi:hypothetical protein